MKKHLVIATLAAVTALSSTVVFAQTAAPDGAPAAKKHPIKAKMHKLKKTLTQPHAPSAPAQPKP
jgi:hypothetical protein